MDQKEREFLEQKCARIRYLTIDEIGELGVGHAGGSMDINGCLRRLYRNSSNVSDCPCSI